MTASTKNLSETSLKEKVLRSFDLTNRTGKVPEIEWIIRKIFTIQHELSLLAQDGL